MHDNVNVLFAPVRVLTSHIGVAVTIPRTTYLVQLSHLHSLSVAIFIIHARFYLLWTVGFGRLIE